MKPFYNKANETFQPFSLKNRSLQKCFSFFVLLIAISLCLSDAMLAQTAPPIQWQKSLGSSYSDAAYSIQQTNDGGFIIAGATTSDDGNVSGLHGSFGGYTDCWIVKLDANGFLIWQKCLGGSYDDEASSIQQTTDADLLLRDPPPLMMETFQDIMVLLASIVITGS